MVDERWQLKIVDFGLARRELESRGIRVADPHWVLEPRAGGSVEVRSPTAGRITSGATRAIGAAVGRGATLAEIISRTALPKGVFNLVMGRGSVVGEALVTSPDVDAISFTGSQSGIITNDRHVDARIIEVRPVRELNPGA